MSAYQRTPVGDVVAFKFDDPAYHASTTSYASIHRGGNTPKPRPGVTSLVWHDTNPSNGQPFIEIYVAPVCGERDDWRGKIGPVEALWWPLEWSCTDGNRWAPESDTRNAMTINITPEYYGKPPKAYVPKAGFIWIGDFGQPFTPDQYQALWNARGAAQMSPESLTLLYDAWNYGVRENVGKFYRYLIDQNLPLPDIYKGRIREEGRSLESSDIVASP